MAADQHLDDKAVLDRFLADNPEFGQLSDRLAQFNIFGVLGVEDAEIRHSNTLAWLLNPEESHGLGGLVLRRILSSILLESHFDGGGISAAQVELLDFPHIEVQREWHHYDLLVVDKGNKLVILVENKVHASVSEKQLAQYLADARAEFPNFTIVPVLLTLSEWDGEDEAPESWIPYSYSRLLGVIERALGQKKSHQLRDDVVLFLNHYLEILRRLTMEDETITKLCKEIYRKHRRAIDLIAKYGTSSEFEEAAVRVLKGHGSYEVLNRNPREVWFIPNAWAKFLPENSAAFGKLSRRISVACRFVLSHRVPGLRLIFEVCKMKDPSKRMESVTALQKAGFKLGPKAFKDAARYSRFYRDAHRVEDLGDAVELEKAAEKLLEKAQARFEEARVALESVFPPG